MKDKDTKELFANMLNEIKSMNNTCDSHGVLDNTIVSTSACTNLGIQINDDLESIKSFADSAIPPNEIPLTRENNPARFIPLLKKIF